MIKMEKKCETCGIKYKYCDFKDDLTEHKCCNKNNQQKFDEKLKKLVFNTCTFSNHDKNKFILLLQNDVYPLYGWLGKICTEMRTKNFFKILK